MAPQTSCVPAAGFPPSLLAAVRSPEPSRARQPRAQRGGSRGREPEPRSHTRGTEGGAASLMLCRSMCWHSSEGKERVPAHAHGDTGSVEQLRERLTFGQAAEDAV